MTDFFASVQHWFVTTEADVIAVIGKIKADVEVVEADAAAALKWLAGEVPTIVTALQTAAGLASAVGLVTAPELAAAQAAVAALSAFAAAQNSGDGSLASDAKSVVDGYVAYQQANSAVAAAKAAAASTAVSPALAKARRSALA